MNKNKLHKNNGFTLVELMVATTIFTMVMVMGVGSLVISSNTAKSSRKLRTAVDNVNFAMESMTRELRTGSRFYCGDSGSYSMANDSLVNDCINGSIIAFNPQNYPSSPYRIAYYRTARKGADGSLDGTYTLERCEFTTSKNCFPVVSDDVDVQLLKFTVKGSVLPPSNTVQPSVEIIMKGVVDPTGSKTPFSLQSMASQRSTE